MKDTYQTLSKPSDAILFKDKNSKFFGYAFPIKNEESIKNHLLQLKKEHHSAGHFCYAYQLGEEHIRYRVNDDGEPKNSAGIPIYGQIQSYDLTNVLIVIVRYFGGTKLGVGGLINAYKTTAQLTLEASSIIQKTINVSFQLQFDYAQMSKVMRILKMHQIEISAQTLNINCLLEISVRKSEVALITNAFKALHKVTLKTN